MNNVCKFQSPDPDPALYARSLILLFAITTSNVKSDVSPTPVAEKSVYEILLPLQDVMIVPEREAPGRWITYSIFAPEY